MTSPLTLIGRSRDQNRDPNRVATHTMAGNFFYYLLQNFLNSTSRLVIRGGVCGGGGVTQDREVEVLNSRKRRNMGRLFPRVWTGGQGGEAAAV